MTRLELTEVYHDTLRLWERLHFHQWGKQITRKDSKFIADFDTSLVHLSNRIFELIKAAQNTKSVQDKNGGH